MWLARRPPLIVNVPISLRPCNNITWIRLVEESKTKKKLHNGNNGYQTVFLFCAELFLLQLLKKKKGTKCVVTTAWLTCVSSASLTWKVYFLRTYVCHNGDCNLQWDSGLNSLNFTIPTTGFHYFLPITFFIPLIYRHFNFFCRFSLFHWTNKFFCRKSVVSNYSI